nr:MAG TPA: hypothetical protein [Caudoviricetes sp.]
MWLLVLILSIKLQMPTWYWIIFTVITIDKALRNTMESSTNK